MIIPFITVVFNWRNEVNQSGLYSIYLRITINRASRYYKIEVPQKIAPPQWTGAEDNWILFDSGVFHITVSRADNPYDNATMDRFSAG